MRRKWIKTRFFCIMRRFLKPRELLSLIIRGFKKRLKIRIGLEKDPKKRFIKSTNNFNY
jgi:hypothetical protein